MVGTAVAMVEAVTVATEQSTYDKIIAHLQTSKIPHTIHEHEESRTFNDAREKLPFPVERLLKTVAFRLKQGGWVLAALRGQDRIDYRKMAEALGVKRSEIVQLSPDEIRAVLQVEAGSVAPIPIAPDTQVLFDSLVNRTETLFTGVGRPDRTFEITLDDLVRATQGRISNIVQDASENLLPKSGEPESSR